MSSDYAIEATALGKCYSLYDHTGDRLKHLLLGNWLHPKKPYFRDFWALKEVSFAITPGEVVGIVGRNGAGKSTLLQMVCGTLQPSAGQLQVNGRVAALLELGAGFNPNFTGIENVYMNAAILGLSQAQVDERLDEILSFADIGDFIGQPVKTYSSGMFMRLAFAVATSVEPDILVIDEALSVGDGAFARKSFDRIMRMKDAGKTILFCSHSMYQVEALCSRALWIENGTLRMIGGAAEVTNAYQTSLNASVTAAATPTQGFAAVASASKPAPPEGSGRILRIYAKVHGLENREFDVVSGETDLEIGMEFCIDPGLPAPRVAFGFADSSHFTVTSVLSGQDGVTTRIDTQGYGHMSVRFPRLPLLKGRYTVTGFLACEKALHIYEYIEGAVTLNVTQKGLEQGFVLLPHEWHP